MKPVIYQIMIRLFGNTREDWKPHGSILENGVGTFDDVSPAALKGIRELGASHVWYTGVIRHATMADNPPRTVKGRAGSPYAITDYYDVNPDCARRPEKRMDEFAALVDWTHQAGLKVLLDFVPNHVARTYRSTTKPWGCKDLGQDDDQTLAFSPQNNFYYLPGEELVLPPDYQPPVPEGAPYREIPARASGNDVFSARPGIDDWFETIKLNYGLDYQQGRRGHFDPRPDTWTKMRDILLFWAAKGVDGFRCDMAEMVPLEFWTWAIAEVKKRHPGILFVGEIYNPQAYRDYSGTGGFDLLYDKVGLYDAIRAVVQDAGKSVDGIVAACQEVADIQTRMVNFLENHDEQRLSSRFFAGDARAFVPALCASAGLGNGAYLVYFGQEWGEKAQGESGFSSDDGRTSIFDYVGVPAHQRWMNHGAFDGGLQDPLSRKVRDWHGLVLGDIRDKDVFRLGETEFISTGDPRVLAWFRILGGKRWLFAANFDRDKDHVFVAAGMSWALTPWGAIWAREV